MKNYSIPCIASILVLAGVCRPAFAVPLGGQNLEAGPGPTTYLGSFFVDGNNYFSRQNLTSNNQPLQIGEPVSGFEGSFAIVTEDMTETANPNNPRGIVRIADVNVAGHDNLQVKVRLGSTYANPGASAWEPDEEVRIEVAFDANSGGIAGTANPTLNQGTYFVVGRFKGTNETGVGPRRDANLDGNGDPAGTPLDNPMQDFSFNVPGVGTTLSVQVVVDGTDGSEEVIIDDIRVEGTVAAGNPPTVGNVEGATLVFTEGDAATRISNTITAADTDSNIESALIEIINNYQNGEDVLGVDGALPAGISTTGFNAGAGTLTLTGSASPASYQTALRQITFQNTSTDPNQFDLRTVRYSVSDTSSTSGFVSRNVDIVSVVAASTIPYLEDFSTDGEGIRYTSNTFADGQVTPQDYFERTTLNPHPGQVLHGTYTFTGPQGGAYWVHEDVTSALNPLGATGPGVVRLPDLNAAGLGSLEVSVFLADANSGTSETDDKIEVQFAFDGNRGGTELTAGSYQTVGRFIGNGTLMKQDTNLDGSSTDPADSGSPSLDTVMTKYTFSIPATGSLLSVQVRVGETDASEEYAFDHIEVTGAVVGNPPALANLEGVNLTYTEGDPVTAGSSAITVSDVDSNIESAVVQLTAGYQITEDLLSAIGALPSGISGSFDSGTGAFNLNGSATPAAYQAALRQIGYQNSNTTNPLACPRTLVYQVSDSSSGSNILSRDLDVVGVVAPGTIPYLEDFDTDGDGVRYTSFSFTDGQVTPQDYFERTDINPHPGQLLNGAHTFTPPQGSGYWTSEDITSPLNKLSTMAIVRLPELDGSGLINRQVSLFLAENGEALEDGEQIEIQVAIDGDSGDTVLSAGTYTTIGRFIQGPSTNLRQDSDLDGSSSDPEDSASPELDSTMTQYTFDIPDGGNIVSVQVKMTNTGGSESISFDHIEVSGVSATAKIDHWTIEEGAGATTADIIDGDDATLQNGAAFNRSVIPPFDFSTAVMEFDGSNDRLVALGYKAPLIGGTNDRSMTAWVKARGANNNMGILAYGQDAGGEKWILRAQQGNGQAGALRVEVSGGFIVGSTVITDGNWHHVAATFADDGTPNVEDVKLYVDGVLETPSATTARAINTDTGASGIDVRIGDDHSNRKWNGWIDEVCVFTGALDAPSIAALAALAPPREIVWDDGDLALANTGGGDGDQNWTTPTNWRFDIVNGDTVQPNDTQPRPQDRANIAFDSGTNQNNPANPAPGAGPGGGVVINAGDTITVSSIRVGTNPGLGYGGHGRLTMDGGSLTVFDDDGTGSGDGQAGNFILGADGDRSGVFVMNNGTVEMERRGSNNANSFLLLGTNNGEGFFEMNGGTFNADAGGIRIADNANARGRMVMTGGTVNISGGNWETANTGIARTIIEGGIVNQLSNNLITGQATTSTSTMTVGGGAGTAIVNVDGGDGNRDWNTNGGHGIVDVLANGVVNVGRHMNLGNSANANSGLELTINGGEVNLGTVGAAPRGNISYRNLGPLDQIDLQDGILGSNGGTINMNDALDAQFSMTGGILANFRNFNNGILVQDGGQLIIGASPGIMSFNTGYTGNGGSVEIEIDGPGGPGVGHDQLDVNGNSAPNLQGVVLDLQPSVTPMPGQTFVIIDNDGTGDAVNGTFAGLPQGALFIANSVVFSIDYAGGDGNDVVLTAEGTLPTAGNNPFTRQQNDQPQVYAFADLLGNDLPGAGGTIDVTGVQATSNNGGTVQLFPGFVVYTPPAGDFSPDVFTYTITETPSGGTATAQVMVTTVGNPATQAIDEVLAAGGDVTVRFTGVPLVTYTIEEAPAAIGPYFSVGTVTADARGKYEVTVTPSFATSFFRSRFP